VITLSGFHCDIYLFTGLKNVLNPDDVDTFADEAIALLESSDDRLVKALSPTKTASSCQTARSTG
jgi:hypothetical protein